MNYINGIYDKLSKEVSADEFFKDSQNIVYLVKLMKICYIKFIDLKWYTKKRFIYADVGNEPFFGFDICAI